MVGILSILFIIVLWVKKDLAAVYATFPKEQVFPLCQRPFLFRR